MYHLYTKVFIIIFIAFSYSEPLIQPYLPKLFWPILFLLLFFSLAYLWCRRKNLPLHKFLVYGIIFSAFALLVGFRFHTTEKESPIDYWQQVDIPTGRNKEIFFLARVKSLDGFKKERYRTTLELLSSHTDKRWMTTIFEELEKEFINSKHTNQSKRQSLTEFFPTNYLNSTHKQGFGEFPNPITVYSFSYLELRDLDPGNLILIRPYFIRKTEDINENSSYRSYLIANGVYANWYFNPRDLRIMIYNHPPFILQVWSKIKNTINRYIEYPSSTLAYAMFTGNKDEMPDYIKEYFRSTGTYHVLAVSGMHAGLLSVFFFYIFRILGMRRKTSLGLIFITILPAYLFITNFQISIQRTYLMGLIGFLLMYYDRSINLMSILCLSFIAISLYNPPVVYSVSFQLSFGAVFGIAQALRLLVLFRVRNAFINGLWVSVGAQLGTLSIVLYYFGYNNFLTLFYNIVISVLISAYYLYTLMFLIFSIPLSYFPGLTSLTDFIAGSLGDFLTFIGNTLFIFLHYTAVEFDWFYFPSLQNHLGYAGVMGFVFFVLTELLYRLRSDHLKKRFYHKPKKQKNRENN